jgi:hypothetical protein
LRAAIAPTARKKWITVWVAFLLSFGFVNMLLAPVGMLIETRSMSGGQGVIRLLPMIAAAVVAAVVARVVFVRMSR